MHKECLDMINLRDEIDTLSNFKRNTSEFLEQLKRTKKPVVLTINGRAELVVQDAGSYQRLLEYAEKLETIEALKPAIAEMKSGQGESADRVFSEILKSSMKEF
jgi:prevent-host-death family protein